jgi:hypothetical protein
MTQLAAGTGRVRKSLDRAGWISIFLTCGTLLGASTGASPVRTVVNRYCYGCHNDQLKTGGLSLAPAAAMTPSEKPQVWEKVVRKLSHRQMPPQGLPRPDESTYQAVVATLEKALDDAAAASPNPGPSPTFRRLTRTEYHNAVRDLLALDVDVSSLLPPDESSHGFDNITVQNLSPVLLERYLAAARKISRLAIGSPVRSPAGDTILIPPDLTQEHRLNGLPFGTRGGARVTYTFPVNGAYDIRLRLTRDRNEQVEGLTATHQLEAALDGVRIGLFEAAPPPKGQSHDGVDRDFHVRIPVTAGPHEVTATFLSKTDALIETERQPYLAHFNMDRHPRLQPALYSITITGPFDSTGAGDTPSRRRIFACHPASAAAEEDCARRILSPIIRRAYRRPVTGADLQGPMAFYRDGRSGADFEAGIEMALRAVLVSPEFLFRIERDAPAGASGPVRRLTDVELASRLSFFLWSSIPDDELLDLASQGKLSDPRVLQQQVRRMLADKRSEALVTNFAAQWLYLTNLDSVTPDPRLFPDFDDNLRQAMRRETELLVDAIVREDRSVLDFLNADYTFVNERLAKHYGIPNIYGARFRRVHLDGSMNRGGLLTQASILAVTSFATRTSPVVRGKWILTNILGTPPAPPPPKIPQLKEAKDDGKMLTMRQRVAQHRANPACASCHNLMDPVGFALENYDAIGRWRTKDAGAPVDASGKLPDGTEFIGASQLQQALLRRPELFVSTLTEKLLTYALGRGLEAYDMPSVRKIVREAAAGEYRFSSLILGIAGSTPFQMRSSQT